MLKRTVLAAFAVVAVAAPVAAEPIVLKLNSPAPPPSYLHTTVFTPWAQEVTRASEGALKIETFYGGTLGSFAVNYDRVLDGVADIGFILPAMAGGRFRHQDVASLPFEAKTSLAASTALWKLFEKGVTAGEFEAVKPLALWTFPSAAIHSKTPVRTLDDLKGKKIVASNAIAAKTAVALGGTPITFRPDEAYQAVSRGIADGVLMPFTGMFTFKLHDVTRHHLDAALGSDSAMLFMNKRRYDALPAKAKQAIDRFSYLALSQRLGKSTDDQWLRARNAVKDRVVTLSAEEEARWKKAVEHLAAEWAKETRDGVKVLEMFRAEIAGQPR